MTGYEARQRQARDFAAGVRYLDANQCSPLHDVVRTLVERCPSLDFTYLSILLGDWSVQFRTEHQAEIDDALTMAMKSRAAC
jgi:hypothetical protein